MSDKTPQSPLNVSRAVLLPLGMMAALLVATLVVPPPRPTLAATVAARHVAAATPSPSPSPSASPSPKVGASPTAAPAPAGSPSPSGSPSPGASSSGSPSPSASPSPGPSPSTSSQAEEERKRLLAIYDKSENLNPKLKDYTAGLDIAVSVKLALLRLPLSLHGTYFYKAPDKHKLELQNAPPLLSKYPQIFGMRPVKPQEHTMSRLPDEELNGRKVFVLRFDKKDNADYRGATLWIDQEDYTTPRRLYTYKDNGKIEVELKWRKDGGYTIPDEVSANFDFPKHGAAATATAKYGSYSFNNGLDDKIFDDKKK